MKKNLKLKVLSSLIVVTFLSQIGASVYASGNNAFSVGADYPNETVDTRSAATSAASKLGAMGYNSYYSTQPTYSILGGNFESGDKRLQSDIVYLNGHGSTDSVMFPNTGLRVGGKDGYYYWGTDNFHWSNVKLAILVACYTSMYGDSIAYRLNWGGATTSVGFPDTVYTSAGKGWSDRFLDKLADGGTVNEAKDAANAGWYAVGGAEIRKATIIGDGDLKISSSGAKSLSSDLQGVTLNERYIEVEKNVFKVNKMIEYKAEYREGKNINISKGIVFENNDNGKMTIIRLLENNIDNFNIENYEMDIQKLDNTGENYAIELHYKIGEYYTNSGYVILVKNNEVFSITDYTINNSEIDNSINNELKNNTKNNIAKSIEELENKAVLQVSRENNSNTKVINSKLFYDLVEHKKYVMINVESKIGNAIAIETIMTEI